MNNNSPFIIFILFALLIFTSCSKDCNEMANVPKWDANKGTFVDNYIEVPCGTGKPIDEPVN